ncbi:transporter substrate-binding domain-containing protein [Allocoprobacillus halotolerans]|uniref:Transporter substrate-binding domain-containing protein n=1 Tax=Allocoprobacillus halotolerans TaxID=2944914 RepID=A0ABY5I2S8_9FIRM|nr:transporter substrate-binding domain-containing protein [Allocoprobacillus halotolerans]UTY39671.1 transporter substrate-binding domain-containing protein [Allocoprobacillus halotolerans]
MKKFGKVMMATLMASLLFGCGSNNATSEKEQFVVGMECGYAPFNWQVSEESETTVSLGNAGYADGYDVQIAKKIADDLGMELVIKKISWDGLPVALESGEIDAIIAGMTADETREEGIDFTEPYYDSEGMIMIVRKDSEEAKFTDIQQFSGKNVVGQKGTNYDDVIDQIKGVNHVTPKATYPEMVVALQQGDVDGITAEMAVAEGVLAANDDLTVVQFDEGKGFECDTTVSIGLKEGTRDSEFFKKVQASLDKITTDERKQLMSDAVTRQPAGE